MHGKLLAALLVLTMALAACAAPGAATPPPATAPAKSTAPLLLVDQYPPGAGTATMRPVGLRARPIDPPTLADLPHKTPFPFGHHFMQAVSPDGRTLAVVVWPNGNNNQGGALRLIDLATWTDTIPGITVNDLISGPVFSADGRSLYWLLPTRHDAAHGLPRAYALQRYELTNRALTTLTTLPASYLPYQLRLPRAGTRLAVYAVPTDTGNLAEDAPHLLLIDLSDGQTVADTRLAGVRAGQFKTARGDYELLLPGLAWDLPRDRLYVAHADTDQVTVVDLASGTVIRQAEIRPRASLPARLAHWLVPAAAAKGGPTTTRQALVSADGARLYLLGQQPDARDPADPDRVEWAIPARLQVVDTSDLSETRRLALPATTGFALAPDGTRLLLHTFTPATPAPSPVPGPPPPGRHELLVLDARTLATNGKLDVPAPFFLQEFSPDGRLVYLSYQLGGATARNVTPLPPATRLQAVDLATRRVVAERVFPGAYAVSLLQAWPER